MSAWNVLLSVSPIAQAMDAHKRGLTLEQAHREHKRNGGSMTRREYRDVWDAVTKAAEK